MKMYKRTAKKLSFDYTATRPKKNIKYIVIHYTSGTNDTAKNNADYFATTNTRQAGAHFFVDRDGKIARSVPLKRTAWSVGGLYSTEKGAGTYYNKCTNYNSVSIELCGVADKAPSVKQVEAVKNLVAYIKKYCKNADTIIRHWDVNGKECPKRMIGKSNKEWKSFKKGIS